MAREAEAVKKNLKPFVIFLTKPSILFACDTGLQNSLCGVLGYSAHQPCFHRGFGSQRSLCRARLSSDWAALGASLHERGEGREPGPRILQLGPKPQNLHDPGSQSVMFRQDVALYLSSMLTPTFFGPFSYSLTSLFNFVKL